MAFNPVLIDVLPAVDLLLFPSGLLRILTPDDFLEEEVPSSVFFGDVSFDDEDDDSEEVLLDFFPFESPPLIFNCSSCFSRTCIDSKGMLG